MVVGQMIGAICSCLNPEFSIVRRYTERPKGTYNVLVDFMLAAWTSMVVIMVAPLLGDSGPADSWIVANWSLSVTFFVTNMFHLFTPVLLSVLMQAQFQWLDPSVNLTIQAIVVLINTGLAIYTMILTRYTLYIYFASFCFIGTPILIWIYSVYLIRTCMAAWIRSDLPIEFFPSSASEDLDDSIVSPIGPLDRLYQDQQGGDLDREVAMQMTPVSDYMPTPPPTERTPVEASPDESSAGLVNLPDSDDLIVSNARLGVAPPSLHLGRKVRVWEIVRGIEVKYFAIFVSILVTDIVILAMEAWVLHKQPSGISSAAIFVSACNLTTPWLDIGLITAFIAAAHQGLTIRDLAIFLGLFVALLFTVATCLGFSLSIASSGIVFDRVNAEILAIGTSLHGYLVFVTTTHFSQATRAERTRIALT